MNKICQTCKYLYNPIYVGTANSGFGTRLRVRAECRLNPPQNGDRWDIIDLEFYKESGVKAWCGQWEGRDEATKK